MLSTFQIIALLLVFSAFFYKIYAPIRQAVLFRTDPLTFIRKKAKNNSSGAFLLNLAGFKVYIITDSEISTAYGRADEETLSSYEALALMGFTDALGEGAVVTAPPFHRKAISKVGSVKMYNAF